MVATWRVVEACEVANTLPLEHNGKHFQAHMPLLAAL